MLFSSFTLVAVLLCTISSLLTLHIAQACHYLEQHPYRNFGIFTDYRAARASLAAYAVDQSAYVHTQWCDVVSFWQFSREGTSLPAYGLVTPSTTQALVFLRDRIAVSHHLGRGSLCGEDLSALVSWAGPPVQVLEGVGELTNNGARDLYAIARRYTSAFYGLSFDYTPGNFRAVHAPYSSSLSSAQSIVYGMAPIQLLQDVSPHPYLRESEDMTQDFCRLSSEVFFGANGKEEAVLDNVTREVSARLGLGAEYFDKDHLHWVYDSCRSAMAAIPEAYSPWCAAFSQDNLKDLELVEDSIWYRRLGLDEPNFDEMLSYQLTPACSSLRHLMEYFRVMVEEGHYSNHRVSTGRVVVGDVTALLRMMAVFGVNREGNGIDVTDPQTKENRRWRVSELAPYGGHVLLSLTRCHNEFFVRAHVQEIPFSILNCPVDCPWEVFKRSMEHLLAYCPDVPYCASRASLVSPPVLPCVVVAFMSLCVAFLSRDDILIWG